MGCAVSKPEETAAVVHCRERSQLLADAIRFRYALSDAHSAYARSLRSLAASLHDFLLPLPAPTAQPLPSGRKVDPPPPPPPAAVARSRSHSGSHIHFHPSDSDSDGDEHAAAQPGPTHFKVTYARSQPAAPSVSYEQRSANTEAVAAVEHLPPAYPYLGYPYPDQSSRFYTNPYPYPAYGPTGGFFAPSPPPPNIPQPAAAASPGSASSSREPLPPPSPPRSSNWDFLNPFESFESYYAKYPSSRSSKGIREEEGIPELEDEENEVVKAANEKSTGAGKVAASTENGGAPEKSKVADAASSSSCSCVDDEVNTVDKSMAGSELHVVKDRRRLAGFSAARTYYNDAEVVHEIKTQFERASESTEQVSKMLEIGKQPYHQKNSVYKVSARMICGYPFRANLGDEDLLHLEEDEEQNRSNLSSTLQKLYMWERKLLDEVKDEEAMRLLYKRKCEELRCLNERGAEIHELEETRASIRKLSTRIRVAFQVVNSVSKKISNLRDQELLPLICELVERLTTMWVVMLQCHHTQCEAVSQARNLDSILESGRNSSEDAHIAATKQLGLELLHWIASFSVWVNTQRSFVRSLNGWLMKGLDYVPEVTDDGVAPFSPGRLGAPPVFVVCNYWSQGINSISETEVVGAMQAFAADILRLWGKQSSATNSSDAQRNVRTMERGEQFMRRELEAHDKKLSAIHGRSVVSLSELVHQGPAAEVTGLHSGLRRIFELTEKFAAAFANAYEDLHICSEEERERLAGENAQAL